MAGTREIARENGKKGGRPKGSTTRPQIKDYFNEEDIMKLISQLKTKAKEGDTHVLKFLGEQIFGRAVQPQEHSGKDGEAIEVAITGMKIINDGNRVSNKEPKADKGD